MSASFSMRTGRLTDTAAVLARCLVGGVFIYMGLAKALEPVDFLKVIRQYETVQSPLLLNLIAAALPWFEVVCGGLLLAGIAVRGAALILISMLVPFTGMVLHRALALQASIPFCAIRFDCGCGEGPVPICRKLLENACLILLSGWIVAGYGRSFCLRYRLFQARENPESQP